MPKTSKLPTDLTEQLSPPTEIYDGFIAQDNPSFPAMFQELQVLVSGFSDRLTRLEATVLCACKTSTEKHEQWCTLYIKPNVRWRDCFNCGNSGFEALPNSTEYKICSICQGAAKVPEQWRDGQLVWPSNPLVTDQKQQS